MTKSASNTTAATSTPDTAEGGSPLGEVDLLGDSSIWTPEIERLINAVAATFRMGFVGMAVDGLQRCGKSWACEFLQGTLADALNYPLATFLWTIPESCKTERDFTQERLRESGCFAGSHRDIAVLRGRLYDHICDSAAQRGGRKVAIIVDEAHHLTREQYYYLIHTDNSLRLRKVRPFFILVGQPELRSTSSSWMKASGYQVVGRFFSRQHRYQGIAVADIQEVVSGFDEPEQGATVATYAKALPEAYAAGWRLSHVAPLLVEAIGSIAKRQNITAGVRVPMQSLRAMLLYILFHYIETKANPASFSMAIALQAVDASGFPGVMEYYVHSAEAAHKEAA